MTTPRIDSLRRQLADDTPDALVRDLAAFGRKQLPENTVLNLLVEIAISVMPFIERARLIVDDEGAS